VDVERSPPGLFGREGAAVFSEAPTERHAGIRAEEIDRPESLEDQGDERSYIALDRDVGRHGKSPDSAGNLGGAARIAIRDHNGPRTFRSEAVAERGADAAGASCHNDHAIAYFHSSSLPCWTSARSPP